MRISSFVLAALGAYVVQGAVLPATHVIHEKRHSHPRQWSKRNRLHSRAVLPMRIGLTQGNLDKGHDLLMSVSDPSSPNYAKHMTSDEVIEVFAPAEKTVSIVREWLVSSGISLERITHTDNKGWLAFDATVEEAESLLHTEYHEYWHESTGTKTAACDSYHVPKHIQEHVDYITPGLKLLANRNQKRGFGMSKGSAPTPPKLRPLNKPVNFNDTKTCDTVITPACLAALYDIPEGTKAHPDNAMGVFEEGDFYAQEDLDLFFANFTGGRVPAGTHPIPAFIDGAEAPAPVADAGGESDLDFELAYPILWPQQTVLYQTDDINVATGVVPNNGGFNTFLDALDGSYCTYSAFGETGNDPVLDPTYPDNTAGGYTGQLQCGVYKPTNVISVSYGGQESDLPPYYQQRQCNEFLKLGLQGISVFYASGDDGVAGPPNDDGSDNCLGPTDKIFSPAWPNSCPWLTNVGATKVYPGHKVHEHEPESAVVDPAGHPYRRAYSSGGGFSNIYPIPDYQKKAVAYYFDNYSPSYPYYLGAGNGTVGSNGGLYNRLGRGYPDVAANGDNIAVFNAGKFRLSGGTSASTPIFAAIINRINEERLAAGKKTVGFVNPVLYSNPHVLNDIKNGTNPGCGTVGFAAVNNWDPVTGLGTPNFPRLLKLFMSLP